MEARAATTPHRGTPGFERLDAREREVPGRDAFALKAMQYGFIAETVQPKLFLDSPFYFELGIDCGWEQALNRGMWLLWRNLHLFRDVNPEEHAVFVERQNQRYCLCCGPYVDLSHNCPSFTNVLCHGLGGIYAQAQEALRQCRTPGETAFVECALQGLLTSGVLDSVAGVDNGRRRWWHVRMEGQHSPPKLKGPGIAPL